MKVTIEIAHRAIADLKARLAKSEVQVYAARKHPLAKTKALTTVLDESDAEIAKMRAELVCFEAMLEAGP